MKSWYHIWPLLAAPFLIFFLLGFFPFVREAFLNHTMIPFLPYSVSVDLVGWYQEADMFQEYLLHLLISINCGILVYPIFFLIGSLYININNAIALSKIKSFNKQ